MFGLNKAFRIQDRTDGNLVFLPINNMEKVMLDDLVGYGCRKETGGQYKSICGGQKGKQCAALRW
ncbi:MAG: hypothetical protein V8R80_09290 [Eubacterium sp.]